MITGRILHTQRLSTEDGPGIRTTMFFKGCPLHCAWCHNPESLSSRTETQWFSTRCIGCETCIAACPNHCLELTASGLRIDRERCQACGTCVEACPSGALESLGRVVTVDELLGELVKDRVYYEKSGGGVTLSGGEPTFQPDFAEALLKGLKGQGLATALDTCGMTTTHILDRLLPYTDLVLFDLKLWDPARHQEFTGQTNERILQNLQYLREWIHRSGRPIQIWVRTPLIPTATASLQNLAAIGRYLDQNMNGTVTRWELCAFNNLCRDKYNRLDMTWPYQEERLLRQADLEQAGEWGRASGINPELVFVTGASRVERSAQAE
jgi:pyruvate formate lyase activating enzyme